MSMIAIFALASSVMQTAASDTKNVQIADLDLTLMLQDWERPQKNLSVDKNPLSVGGKTYAKGVGTHANSYMCIRLDGKALRFTALVEVDDEQKGKGTVEFIVKKDGKTVWKSGVMRAGEPAKNVDVDLRGAGRLGLMVTDGGDGIDSDHADWVEAAIEMKKDAPAPVLNKIGDEKPMKIASGIPQKTQINGPRVIGTTPGNPFMWRIPASGKRPFQYKASGLPAGLSLDPSTGIISGSVQTAGETVVKIEVKGPKGKDSREVRIVAGEHKLAMTPPMGWNSWNCWASSITADKVRDAAKAMATSGLADFGYQYVNIDDCWEAGRDANGEIQTNEKFGDMEKLAGDVHALGLKLGIYSSPGPYTCAGYTGSYKHEHQDAATYAKWGIDYLKYDWCSYGSVAKEGLSELQKPYKLMREALDACGRDIVYSLCQYGMGDVHKWGGRVGGDLWRTTGDITDSWSSMASIGFSHSEKSPFAGPSGWNDPDMLVVGWVGWSSNLHATRLTPNEQIAHITLWSMLAAPLIIGCDMTRLDQFTKDLLMNHDVIEVDQDPLGKAATVKLKNKGLEVWTRPLFDGSYAVALFNRGMVKQRVKVKWPEIGLAGPMRVRDLWLRKDAGIMKEGLSREVPAHGAMLFKAVPIR